MVIEYNPIEEYIQRKFTLREIKINRYLPSIYDVTENCHQNELEPEEEFERYIANLSVFKITTPENVSYEYFCFNCEQVILNFTPVAN